MNKMLSLIMAIALFLGASSAVSAAEKDMTIHVGKAVGFAGETIQIPVELENNSGFSNLGIEISYDENTLSLVSVTGNTSVGAIMTGAQEMSAVPYNISWDSASNNTYEGTLATLTFRVSANAVQGSYPITISYYKGRDGKYNDGIDVNYDENFEPLELTYINGEISIDNGMHTVTFETGYNTDVIVYLDADMDQRMEEPYITTDSKLYFEALHSVMPGGGELRVTSSSGELEVIGEDSSWDEEMHEHILRRKYVLSNIHSDATVSIVEYAGPEMEFSANRDNSLIRVEVNAYFTYSASPYYGIVIVSAYTDDGKLYSTEIRQNQYESIEYILENIPDNVHKLKAMWWSDAKSMSPVCECKELTVE